MDRPLTADDLDLSHINIEAPEWRAAMEVLRLQRADLVSRLVAHPRGRGDNANILRGRIVQIDELLTIKPKPRERKP